MGLIITDKKAQFPREMLPTDIPRIQPCLSARRYVLSALIIRSLSPWLWLKTVGICLINAKCYSLFLGTENPAAQGNLFCDSIWKQGTWE